ncbi:Bug family tripartite tricarboxylate transporter substrate binding protein [Paracandidimonas soli]|uniref:Bug family tripartite tricarboxylate transporter substrate binding protein n=1 Tax=Paracandidimonas soli TaxID=1917182 RepID=UPI0033411614
MQPARRSTLRLAAMTLFLGAAMPAAAQPAYPSKPVTIVVPHAPGGAVDGVARLLANKLQEDLKQTVVVENRAGASGMIGAAHVARSEADGYTLYFNASIHVINPLLYAKSIQFDAINDFTPISMVAQGELIFSVNPQLPVDSVAELVQRLKDKPQNYTFVTSGFGSAGHLGAAKFLHEVGVGKEVPIALYKGAAPALQDLVGGNVTAIMDPMLSSLPFVKAGKLHALAVTGAKRNPLLPDVPTMQEAGFKDFELYSWYGLWAPAKLPADIRDKLDAAARHAVEQADFKERLTTLGFEPYYRNAKDFSGFINAETTRYDGIIKAADIKID